MPRIGITTRTNGKEYLDRWFRNYWWAIVWAGGEPVVLTPENTSERPAEQVDRLDGLFLPGGGDVHPRYFGQQLDGADPTDIHVDRDELELSLAQAALAADIPILGVCRGLQVLNIVAGGSLLQHVEGHQSPREGAIFHPVDVQPNTLLARVLGADGSLITNTYHHQAVTNLVLAPDFRASAHTIQGPPLLEAFESPGHRWVLAVQWHPERFFELDPIHRRLFIEFILATRQNPLAAA
jgi:putative glutamine amidotransferase